MKPAPPPVWAVQIADEARMSLGRLRTGWGWLAEHRIPGPPPQPVDRPTRPVDATRLAAQYAADRAAAQASIRRRITPGHTRPVPVRLAAVTARQIIAADLAALAGRLHAAIHYRPLTLPVVDPHGRQATTTCTWCAGAATITRPAGWAWPWPTEQITCPRCWHGRIPAGTTCQGCGLAGPCGCDRADVLVGMCLPVVAALLDDAATQLAADADETLHHLAGLAETVVGCGPDRRRLPGHPPPECPVCGSRELHADVGSPDRREWSIRCTHHDCVCTGPGCACGIGTARRRDRHHLWPARLWDGPDGLAARIGVTLPGTQPATLERIFSDGPQ